MREWQLNREGYVMQYMLAGPQITDYVTDTRNPNQLQLEAILRKEIVTQREEKKEIVAKVGQTAENGCGWGVYYAYGNCFVDCSDFYSVLKKIHMAVATVLCVPQDMDVNAVVWTYMSVGVYCNGILEEVQSSPVYKPIHHKKVKLHLKKGRNVLYFDCENLGVRDTRNILGLQIIDHVESIRVQLPDEDYQEQMYEAQDFLNRLSLDGGILKFPKEAPKGTFLCCSAHSPDYEVTKEPLSWKEIEGSSQIELSEDISSVQVRLQVGEVTLSRGMEITGHLKPKFSPEGISTEDNFQLIMERIALVGSLNRGPFGFAISNILARKYLHQESPKDKEYLFDTLRLIDLRVDCSDFLMCGLLRYMHHYEMDELLKERTKEVLLRYRYWMNMEGADAMCFWSENHSLMFYACAMDVGTFYPDAYFVRAKMTGTELSAYGRKKVLEWFEDVETYGFEEFLSTVYMCVTFAALLNVIDFSEEEISRRATAIADQLLGMLCTQAFQGCVIAPMGRTYRDVLYPFSQGAQAMINMIDPKAPYSYGEGWLAFLADSKYQIPEGLLQKMQETIEVNYVSGNARIFLEKNTEYCLTSVQSPREVEYERWPNIQKNPNADMDTHEYNKSLNECFHGTTCFGPGVFGYQQHMWYAALDGEAVIFTNHPGTTAEWAEMRPGYWNGNGVMPAISQKTGMLGVIYDIPQTYPIHFTHVYCPVKRFDEVIFSGQWIFMRKGNGYLALWCSGKMIPYDDMMFDCELRVYGDSMAYLCVCGGKKEYASFQEFMDYAVSCNPVYQEKERILQAKEYHLVYRECQDETQYID